MPTRGRGTSLLTVALGALMTLGVAADRVVGESGDAAAPLIVTVSPLRAALPPGGHGAVEVTVANPTAETAPDVVVEVSAVTGESSASWCSHALGDVGPGAETDFICEGGPVAGSTTVDVTAQPRHGPGPVAPGSGSATVAVQGGAPLAVEVTPVDGDIDEGEDARFRVTLTNESDHDVSDVRIEAATTGCGLEVGDLPAGPDGRVAYECRAPWGDGLGEIDAPFVQSLTATGVGDDVGTIEGFAAAPLSVGGVAADGGAMTVTVSPASQTVEYNGSATTQITFTNTGTQPLVGVSGQVITTPFSFCSSPFIGSLAVGATRSATCSIDSLIQSTVLVVEATAVEESCFSCLVSATSNQATITVSPRVLDLRVIPDGGLRRGAGPNDAFPIRGLGVEELTVGEDLGVTVHVANLGAQTLSAVQVGGNVGADCARGLGSLPSGAAGRRTFRCTIPWEVLLAGLSPSSARVDIGFTASGSVTSPAGQISTDFGLRFDVRFFGAEQDIEMSVTPDVVVIDIGGSADVTLTLRNRTGVPLTDVTLDFFGSGTTSPCVPTFQGVSLGSLAVDEVRTLSCRLDRVSTSSFDGFSFSSTALGTPCSGCGPRTVRGFVSGSATLAGERPILTAVPRQLATPPGQDALVDVTITNPDASPLTSIQVASFSAPDCARSLPTLAGGATTSFSCAIRSGIDMFGQGLNGRLDLTGVVNGGSVPASAFFTVRQQLTGAPARAFEATVTPALQVVPPGGTARLEMTLSIPPIFAEGFNEVNVSDPNLTDCDRQTFFSAPTGATSVSATCWITEGQSFEGDTTFAPTVVVSVDRTSSITDHYIVPVAPVEIRLADVGLELDVEMADSEITHGQTAEAQVTVRNPGSVAARDIAISAVAGFAVRPECERTIASLAAGASTTYSCSWDTLTDVITSGFLTATGLVPSDLQFSATGRAGPGAGSPVAAWDRAALTIDYRNDLEVRVVPSPASVEPGGSVELTVTVTNRGGARFAIVDMRSLDAPHCVRDIPGNDLLPGQSPSASVTYTCVATEGVHFSGTSTLSIDAGLWRCTPFPGGDARLFVEDCATSTSVTGSAVVAVGGPAPGISVTKTAVTPVVEFGDDATFEISVRNSGAAPLTGVTATDPVTPACARSVGALAVGATSTWTCMARAGVDFTDDFTNTVTVSGTGSGSVVSASDSASVVVTDPGEPGLAVSKVALTPTVEQGDDALFRITVTNTGAVPLADVELFDALAPACTRSVGALAPGASSVATCAAVWAVDFEDDFTNTVEANASYEDEVLEAISSASVTVIEPLPPVPGLAVDKVAVTPAVDEGEDATFRITVRNTGEVPLVAVVALDAATPSCARTVGALATAGVSTWTCVASWGTDFSATFTNTVVAEAVTDDAAATALSASDSASVTVRPVAPPTTVPPTTVPPTTGPPTTTPPPTTSPPPPPVTTSPPPPTTPPPAPAPAPPTTVILEPPTEEVAAPPIRPTLPRPPAPTTTTTAPAPPETPAPPPPPPVPPAEIERVRADMAVSKSAQPFAMVSVIVAMVVVLLLGARPVPGERRRLGPAAGPPPPDPDVDPSEGTS